LPKHGHALRHVCDGEFEIRLDCPRFFNHILHAIKQGMRPAVAPGEIVEPQLDETHVRLERHHLLGD
jgi:hypothetical protein